MDFHLVQIFVARTEVTTSKSLHVRGKPEVPEQSPLNSDKSSVSSAIVFQQLCKPGKLPNHFKSQLLH